MTKNEEQRLISLEQKKVNLMRQYKDVQEKIVKLNHFLKNIKGQIDSINLELQGFQEIEEKTSKSGTESNSFNK